MTNAIIMNSIFPFLFTNNTDKKAKVFIETARQTIEMAEKEVKFGDAAKEYESPNLMEIAIWHYENGLSKFREAIVSLEKAKNHSLSVKYKNYVENKIKDCYAKTQSLVNQKQALEILLNK